VVLFLSLSYRMTSIWPRHEQFMRTRRSQLVVFVSGFIVAVGFGWFAAIAAGRLLVADRPECSDVIVVLFGGINDLREQKAMALLREGYARELILDVPDWTLYGRNQPDEAASFLRNVAPDQAGHVHVCSFSSDSTRGELAEIGRCIRTIAPTAHSGIVVTSNYHTRRALKIVRRVLPDYHWSTSAAPDPQFDVHWWRSKEYCKTLIMEWQKFLWWTVIEQWKLANG
jgi:uncharacterized SAM-binding protein YcdF (DUF218 family)